MTYLTGAWLLNVEPLYLASRRIAQSDADMEVAGKALQDWVQTAVIGDVLKQDDLMTDLLGDILKYEINWMEIAEALRNE